eukprot:GHVL01000023.1.p1 GENE.GHVL01000023.1~~GHVL01000023.1.p1  ORF type:complete len:398 (-),score=56.49 GHVL01000023.1:90-1283(-)
MLIHVFFHVSDGKRYLDQPHCKKFATYQTSGTPNNYCYLSETGRFDYCLPFKNVFDIFQFPPQPPSPLPFDQWGLHCVECWGGYRLLNKICEADEEQYDYDSIDDITKQVVRLGVCKKNSDKKPPTMFGEISRYRATDSAPESLVVLRSLQVYASAYCNPLYESPITISDTLNETIETNNVISNKKINVAVTVTCNPPPNKKNDVPPAGAKLSVDLTIDDVVDVVGSPSGYSQQNTETFELSFHTKEDFFHVVAEHDFDDDIAAVSKMISEGYLFDTNNKLNNRDTFMTPMLGLHPYHSTMEYSLFNDVQPEYMIVGVDKTKWTDWLKTETCEQQICLIPLTDTSVGDCLQMKPMVMCYMSGLRINVQQHPPDNSCEIGASLLVKTKLSENFLDKDK